MLMSINALTSRSRRFILVSVADLESTPVTIKAFHLKWQGKDGVSQRSEKRLSDVMLNITLQIRWFIQDDLFI